MEEPVHRTDPEPPFDVAASSTVRVDETIDLAAIFEPHVNAVVLRRRAHEALGSYCAEIARSAPFSFTATAAFAQPSGLDELDLLARELPPDDARDVLVEDIAYWIEVVTEITGSPRTGVRLVRLASPMCPRFHHDHVALRLVCTYAGAGSEWLDERAVDRSLSLAPRPGAVVERAAPLDVVLFKGSAWPGNGGRGVVHRSPPASAPRLLLTIDPLG